jgi:hypothetical protein
VFSVSWMPLEQKSEEKAGGTQTREHRSPSSMQFARRKTHIGVLRRACGAIRNSLIVLHFARRHRAAPCAARFIARAGATVTVGNNGA